MVLGDYITWGQNWPSGIVACVCLCPVFVWARQPQTGLRDNLLPFQYRLRKCLRDNVLVTLSI